MISLDIDLPKELLPFAWINGVWKGFGVQYDKDNNPTDVTVEMYFECESNSYQQAPFLKQTIHVYSVDVEKSKPVAKEMSGLVGYENLVSDKLVQSRTAYWNIGKAIKPTQPKTKAHEITAVSTSSTGHAGSWYGMLDGPRIQMVTDAFLACEQSEQYGGERQLYGLVESDLMFLVEVPDSEKQVRPILSVRMSKVETIVPEND